MAGLVADRYELLEVLGQGAHAEVVRAVDRQHDRLVALKVRRVAPDEAREPLLAESRALLELEPHPALPVVRDDFFLDDRHVLVMDWVDGTNVGRIVRERGDPGLAADSPDALVVWGTQAIVLGWQRGEVGHLVEPARRLLDQYPDLTAWPAAVTLVQAVAGLRDEARAQLRACATDLDGFDFSATWTAAMLVLAEVCRILDAPEYAAAIYERLLPYAQTLCVVSLNLSEMGPLSRPLGVLATLMDDYAHAERHFEDALATSERIGAPPHVARTSSDYARMLLARRRPGDVEHAVELLRRARSIAHDIGMNGVLADVDEMEQQLSDA